MRACRVRLVRVLSGEKRICVIENEFGEINIDEKLVSENMSSKEDLIQMDNGCACCSIRGDLVRTLGTLVEKRKQFDAILLETTGLADPAQRSGVFSSESPFCLFEDASKLIDTPRRTRPVACAALLSDGLQQDSFPCGGCHVIPVILKRGL